VYGSQSTQIRLQFRRERIVRSRHAGPHRIAARRRNVDCIERRTDRRRALPGEIGEPAGRVAREPRHGPGTDVRGYRRSSPGSARRRSVCGALCSRRSGGGRRYDVGQHDGCVRFARAGIANVSEWTDCRTQLEGPEITGFVLGGAGGEARYRNPARNVPPARGSGRYGPSGDAQARHPRQRALYDSICGVSREQRRALLAMLRASPRARVADPLSLEPGSLAVGIIAPCSTMR